MNGSIPIDVPPRRASDSVPASGVAASAVLLVEVERAVRAGSPERRAQMLRQVTGLFLSAAERMNENQIGMFDDILLRLIEWMEPAMLAQLSATLADFSTSPRRIVAQLAYHHEAFVAIPVLAKSDRLSDGDLIMIANSRSPQHLLAISGRSNLSEALTDIILQRGNSVLFHALANNTDARFSGSGFAILIKACSADEVLAHKLGLRSDIQPHMLRALLSKASAVVGVRLLKAASPEARERIAQAMQV
jgi:hypothetical protein